jgi:carboxypeptidase Taq
MVRYEIERALIEGQMTPNKIPEAWNDRMRTYLGLTPPTDTEGCLQDIHWSHGSFGYFPTYTLGNLYAAQFFSAAHRDIPNLSEQLAKGRLRLLKDWLNREVHHRGKSETPDQIVQRVTGEPLNPRYFTEYLWEKFTDIYHVSRPTAAIA